MAGEDDSLTLVVHSLWPQSSPPFGEILAAAWGLQPASLVLMSYADSPASNIHGGRGGKRVPITYVRVPSHRVN